MIFSALADPTRRQIFEALRDQPKTVGELSAVHPVSRPAVSQHLRVLREAGLVDVQPQGTRRFYSVRRDGLLELRRYLDSFWFDVLSAYQTEVKRRIGAENATTDNQDN